jgi:GNAT superfamily N-acetyltransferase
MPAVTADVTVEVAGEADLDVILDILRSANTGRSELGAASWGRNFPDVERDIPAGLVHVARRHGRPVGTFVLRWSDEGVWGPDDGAAGYLHRLATRPDVAGQGVGLVLIAAADALIRERGRILLRLDCNFGAGRLRAYYEAQGFTHAGDAEVPRLTRAGYRSASRYQRPVATVDR